MTYSAYRRDGKADNSAPQTVPTIQIRYAITDNNMDGSPWPPDGHGYWAVVPYPSATHTKWRSISLSSTAIAQPWSST